MNNDTLQKYAEFLGNNMRPGSLYNVLGTHGKHFEVGGITEVQGKLGECYRNAMNLVIMHPERYVYCQGYASHNDESINFFPFEHGWVLDKEDRKAYCATWKEGMKECYGIAFKTDWLLDFLLDIQLWGIPYHEKIAGAFIDTDEQYSWSGVFWGMQGS